MSRRMSLQVLSLTLRLHGLRGLFRIFGALLPGLMSQLAYRLWFTPPRFKTPLREIFYEETAQREFVPHDSGPLPVYRWGEGPRVLLIHGWGGRGTQMHAFVNPLVDNGYQVIALDGPAHGRHPGKQTTIFEFVSALRAVNEQYGPFDGVVAHSFGNPALILALFEGAVQARRVVGISPPFSFEDVLEKFCRQLALPAVVRKKLHERISREFGEDIWHWLRADTLAPKMVTPAIMFHDHQDREIPLQEGQAAAAQWPGARFVQTRGLGHFRIIRSPEVVDAAVEFIATGKLEQPPLIHASPAVIQIEAEPAGQSLWKALRAHCPFRSS